MPFTPNYAIPYHTTADAPNGALLGEAGFLRTDTVLKAVDNRVLALETTPVLTRINESVLTGTAATVTFSGIPQTFRALRLLCMCRGDTAAAFVTARLRFNGDSAGNYDAEQDSASGSTAAAFESLNQTGADIGEATASTAVAGSVSIMDVSIPWYTNTVFWKSLISTHMLQAQTSGGAAGAIHSKQWVSRWRNTGAITSITIYPTAGNFISGSSFVLYGLP